MFTLAIERSIFYTLICIPIVRTKKLDILLKSITESPLCKCDNTEDSQQYSSFVLIIRFDKQDCCMLCPFIKLLFKLKNYTDTPKIRNGIVHLIRIV